MNYPLLYQPLMKMLEDIDSKVNIMHVNNVFMHGIRFEDETCSNIPHFEVCYGSKNKVEGTCTLSVEVRTTMKLDEPVRELKPGVLYHLRPLHPVIDAVGYLRGKDNISWLVLVKVSLSDYSHHDSKAEDLLKPPVKCELTVDKEANTWLQYYRGRIKAVSMETKVKQLYIYVSPGEFIEDGKVHETLEKYSHLSVADDFFFGLVLKSSKTARLVDKYVSNSRPKSKESV